jgi:hypothetical protein
LGEPLKNFFSLQEGGILYLLDNLRKKYQKNMKKSWGKFNPDFGKEICGPRKSKNVLLFLF